MKKGVVSSIFACMLVLMTGCGAANEIEAVTMTENGTIETETIVSSEATEEIMTEVSDMASETIPQIRIENKEQTWDADDGTRVYTLEYPVVEVTNQGFEDLKASLDAIFSRGEQDDFSSEFDLIEEAKDYYKSSLELGEDGYFIPYESSETVAIARCDENILSLVSDVYDYFGGAHGMYGSGGYTYEVSSGKILQLVDLLTDEQAFYEEATPYVCDELYRQFGNGLYEEYKDTVKKDWTYEDLLINYYLNGTGIVVIYNPYEVGPYAMGKATVTLPYAVFGKYIKEEYQFGSRAGLAEISANVNIGSIVGAQQEVMFSEKVTDAEYGYSNFKITSGEKVETLCEECSNYMKKCILIKREDGRSFLFISIDAMSDDYISFAYEITNGEITLCEKINDVEFMLEGSSFTNISAKKHVDALGSYIAQTSYSLHEDGTLTESQDIMPILHKNFLMTVTKELPVSMDGVETTLSTGTQLYITGTDGNSIVSFETTDGRTGTISIEKQDNWGYNINGISENDYFEMVPYAG